jgi:integrase/recombinase XerC
MTGSNLERRRGELIHAETWADLSSNEKRRRAMRAANDKDIAELLSLVEAYTTIFFGKMSNHTVASYKQGITLLCNEGFNLVRLAPDEAAMYIRRLSLDYATASVVQHLSSARVLFDALIWADAYRDEAKDRPLANPFAKVRTRKDGTAPEDKFGTYTDDDLRLLLPHTTVETRTLLFLGTHGGLRASEMTALEWQDIDLRNKQLVVEHGKGDKRRYVPLTQTLHGVLKEAKAEKSKRPLPYSDRFALSHAFEKLCKSAGVMFGGKALHGLRHYAGTKAYQATTDLLRVGKFLGHSNPETTARYAKTLLAGFDDSYLEEFRVVLLPHTRQRQAPDR